MLCKYRDGVVFRTDNLPAFRQVVLLEQHTTAELTNFIDIERLERTLLQRRARFVQ